MIKLFKIFFNYLKRNLNFKNTSKYNIFRAKTKDEEKL